MKRVIKGSFSRVFSVTKAFLLVSSCFMVSNLWTMESDENRTKDGYYTAELINKAGVSLFVVVSFYDDLTNRDTSEVFTYGIGIDKKRKIRVKNSKKEIANISIGNNKKDSMEVVLNDSDFEEIKVGKVYEVTVAEKWVAEFKEVE